MALTETGLIEGHDYTFKQLRQMLAIFGPVQEGVVGAGDFKATAGAGMSCDVAAGQALVQMDSGVGNNLYPQGNDATVNVIVGASHGSLPRVDQLVLQIRDPNVTGVFDTAQLYVLPGVATAGATLDNRTGAVALPNDHMRVADLLIPAASSTVSAGNIRDRRPWARGIDEMFRNNFQAGGVGSTPTVFMTASRRYEFSGKPVETSVGTEVFASVSGVNAALQVFVDGAAVGAQKTKYVANTSNGDTFFADEFVDPIAAGSHLIDWRINANIGTVSVTAFNSNTFRFREHLSANANNL